MAEEKEKDRHGPENINENSQKAIDKIDRQEKEAYEGKEREREGSSTTSTRPERRSGSDSDHRK